MKKVILGLSFLAMTVSVLNAQTCTVVGQLKEKQTDAVIEYGTISIHDATTQKVVSGGMTDADGKFQIGSLKAGTYFVEGSYVGFSNVKSKVFKATDNNIVNIGTLYLQDVTQTLGEVVVKGRKSTFVAKLDRKVFNVGQDLLSTSGSASDLMQNIPSVDVDMDGTVSLRGNENVTILINGKPSAMMSSKTRGDALNQLSAANIEKIEVITNPSAEYKPDGVSGIINIVLKNDIKGGLNGSFTGNIGNAGRNNTGVNLNYGLRHINMFGGYTYRRDRYDRSINDKRNSDTDYINQITSGLGRPISHTLRLGINADISSNDQLEMAGNYNRRNFQRNERIESETTDLSGGLTDFYQRVRDAFAKENMWEGTVRYTHSYGKENEWSIDYAYSSESEDEINRYSTSRMSGDTKDNEGVWDANYLHIGKVNWEHHFTAKLQLVSGYELEHQRYEQNYHLSDWDGSSYIPNIEGSSDFTHYRTIHSIYSTLQMNLSPWSFLLGLRGELANIENRMVSLNKSSFQHYVNLYPTVHLSRQLNAANELQLNYSLRVNRPDGDEMNPFSERINPLSMKAGNPYLKPEKIHSVEAGWLWHSNNGISLMATLYYRYLTNKITNVSYYQDNGVLLTTKENLNSSQSAGSELILTYPVAKWLSVNWNIDGFYNQIDATRLGYGTNKSTFSWTTLLNANFTPADRFMVQLNARYRSAQLIPQGQRDPDCRINLGVKYDFPSIPLSLLASVTDLFDTYRKSYTLDTPELKQKVEQRRNPRIIYVGLSWQFGADKRKKRTAKLEYDETM